MSNNIIVNYKQYTSDIQEVRVNIDTNKYQTYKIVEVTNGDTTEKFLQVLTRDLESPYITTFNMSKVDVLELIKVLSDMNKQL